MVADRLQTAQPASSPHYAQPVEIVADMVRERFIHPRSQDSVVAPRTQRDRQPKPIERRDCPEENPKTAVLQELYLLVQDRESRHETVLGRFLQCQELQMCAALLARAVEQCSRWHSGKRLAPPGGCLPPTG